MISFLSAKFNNRYNFILVSLSALSIALLVLLQLFIQGRENERNAERTAELLLQDVSKVLEQNERERSMLIDTQKQSCILHARAISYLLEHNPEARYNWVELQRLAGVVSVDEIHIFDREGRIISGSVPKYYGLKLTDGSQMSFFLPMLSNNMLTMCQDVTPNTAEGKQMMYAMVWNSDGTEMVEVGLEPRRLLDELKQTSLAYVISKMPTPEGTNISVASLQTGEIYGDTVPGHVGCNVRDFGADISQPGFSGVRRANCVIDGVEYHYSMCQSGPYLLGVLQESAVIQQGLLGSGLLVLVYLLLAATLLVFAIRYLRGKLQNEMAQRQHKDNMLRKMAKIYYSLHLVDLDTGMMEEYFADERVRSLIKLDVPVWDQIDKIMVALIRPEHLARMLRFVDFKTLPERLKDRNSIFEDFQGYYIWIRAGFIVIERRADGSPRTVMFRTLDIQRDKLKELKLTLSSTTDGLTGCLNRHACDLDLEQYKKKGDLPEHFVFVALDVNGLKQVNDNLGHQAGDELLCGAADVIQAAFGPYGKVYRMGGDEFLALIEADDMHLQAIKDDFKALQQNWHGTQVQELNISVGYAAHAELPECSLLELSKQADQNMYADKSAFYRRRGFDRRGQQAAQKALAQLYTKILQVNLAEDTYQIIRMPDQEKDADCGFSEKISSWLHDFGTSGRVHPEDRAYYLEQTGLARIRNYFHSGGRHLQLQYRRREGDGFRRVCMEMIPGEGFSEETPIIYLYVKNIE